MRGKLLPPPPPPHSWIRKKKKRKTNTKVGIAEDVSELDIKVRLMHLHGPVKNFFRPMRNDKC